MRTEEQIDALACEIADYIIETKCSTREAAEHFGVSNYTVSNYMNNKLLKDDSRYKEVKKILNSHNLTVDKDETKTRIINELNLFKKGHTLNEIARITGISESQVSRDLTERLSNIPNINKETINEISKKLRENSEINLNIGSNMSVQNQERDKQGRFK